MHLASGDVSGGKEHVPALENFDFHLHPDLDFYNINIYFLG